MNKKEKEQILIFSREAFNAFYDENWKFLSERKYKPGKKTYRNLLSLNKMMSFYIDTPNDYIKKADVIRDAGWGGSSSYVQHERIITNFDLSDTSWEDRDRSVLLLNDNGKKLRKKYLEYVKAHAIKNSDLLELRELPQFAKNYLIDELRKTNSSNMTLWKNTIISTLYLYCTLGHIPDYSSSVSSKLTDKEKRALINCCNYVEEDGKTLMDLTYLAQPVAMLKNLGLMDSSNILTDGAYKLLKEMMMFKEVESSIADYSEVLGEDLDKVQSILDSKVNLQLVEAPPREKRVSKVSSSSSSSTKASSKAKNKDFDKANKENKLTGDLGEKLVLDYEKEKLKNAGVADIEDKVFLTSSKKEKYGNAYPCDIISYDPITDSEIFIEVKTTKGGADTPFFISAQEVEFSIEHESQYRLYRVFQAFSKTAPQFYETYGKVEDNFHLEEERYIATREL